MEETDGVILYTAAIVTDRLLSLPEYEAAQRLSVYLSMPSGEITTSSIVRDAFNKGKTVFVPYIYQKQSQDGDRKVSIMEMLRLRSVEDYESLQSDRWGIPSIGADTVADRENCQGGFGLRGESSEPIAPDGAGLDLIVVPGMAFDRDLRRLGHGKGYYDHFLNRCWNNLRGSDAQTPHLGKKGQKQPTATSKKDRYIANMRLPLCDLKSPSLFKNRSSLPPKIYPSQITIVWWILSS